jgi:exopolysaccharide biosynthesis polyprenyl glycosylphosphotransferase
LLLLAPLLAVISLMIKLDSPGPVIFRQRRKGFNGREFTIYKFRTMSVLEDGATICQARRNDGRVTRIGRLLRATSIDELPQLVNVLEGDMSVVGPRPHALAHDDEYSNLIGRYAFRHHVKPGITGWAQVNGFRGETPEVELMKKRVDFDLWYINHWSAWLDFWITLRTCLELARGRNAY